MKIIKEGIEEKGRDYIGPSYGYDYEPQYFIIYDETGEPVDVFEGAESDCIRFMNDEYGNAYSCEEVTSDEYFDAISELDLIDFDKDDFDRHIKEVEEAVGNEEDPKVTKFKSYYKNFLALPEEFELTLENVDNDAFKMVCNNLGWNYDSARNSVLKEEWKPLTEEDMNE